MPKWPEQSGTAGIEQYFGRYGTSVYRVKLHLAGGYPDVTSCPNCPEPVKEEIRAFIWKKKETASSITPLPDFDEMGNEEDIDEDESDPVLSESKQWSPEVDRARKPQIGHETARICNHEGRRRIVRGRAGHRTLGEGRAGRPRFVWWSQGLDRFGGSQKKVNEGRSDGQTASVSVLMGYNGLQDLIESERAQKESVMKLKDGMGDFDVSLAYVQLTLEESSTRAGLEIDEKAEESSTRAGLEIDEQAASLRKLLHHFPRTYADLQNAQIGIADGQYLIFVGNILSSR
ncbi:hypothetical protein C3L33_17350, partial [Rhododendron williamsianum]